MIIPIRNTKKLVTTLQRYGKVLFSTHTEHNELVQKAFTSQVSMIDGKQGPSKHWADNADWIVNQFSNLSFINHKLGSKTTPLSIPSVNILEVAAGTAMISRRLAKKFPNATITALDFTEAMLFQGQEKAKEEGLNDIHFKLGSLYEIPFPNASFDIVIGRWFLHHLLDVPAAVKEIYRVIRPDGFFINADVAPPEDKEIAQRMDALEKDRDPSHVSFPARTYLDQVLINSNFSIIERHHKNDKRDFEKWTTMAYTPEEGKKKIKSAFLKEIENPGDRTYTTGFEPYREGMTQNICFTFQSVYTAAQKLK